MWLWISILNVTFWFLYPFFNMSPVRILDEQCCQFMSIYSCHDPLCMLIMTVLNNKTNGGYFTAVSSVSRVAHTIVRQGDNGKKYYFYTLIWIIVTSIIVWKQSQQSDSHLPTLCIESLLMTCLMFWKCFFEYLCLTFQIIINLSLLLLYAK